MADDLDLQKRLYKPRIDLSGGSHGLGALTRRADGQKLLYVLGNLREQLQA